MRTQLIEHLKLVEYIDIDGMSVFKSFVTNDSVAMSAFDEFVGRDTYWDQQNEFHVNKRTGEALRITTIEHRE